jgi:hypothetical protein
MVVTFSALCCIFGELLHERMLSPFMDRHLLSTPKRTGHKEQDRQRDEDKAIHDPIKGILCSVAAILSPFDRPVITIRI